MEEEKIYYVGYIIGGLSYDKKLTRSEFYEIQDILDSGGIIITLIKL